MLNSPHWIKNANKSSPFAAGDKARDLALMVADDELERTPALELLRALGKARPGLNFVSPTGSFGGKFTVADGQTEVDYDFRDGGGTRVFIYGDWWRRVASEQAADFGLSESVLERRFLLAHEAGRREWIDGLIIPWPPPMAERWRNLWVKAPVLTDLEAIALTGLFLRAHGDFTIEQEGRHGTHLNQEDFYRVGAAAELPGITNWLFGALEEWRSSGDPSQFELAEAVLVRFGRALKARDYLQIRRRAADRDAAWSDVLFFFESILLSLQGSLDAAARFLHLRYGLKGSARGANWGRQKWRERLDASPAPTEVFDGQAFWNLDVLVGELRNSIHGAVLSQEFRKPGEAGEQPTFMSYMRSGIAVDAELAEQITQAGKQEDGEFWLEQTYADGVGLIGPWSYGASVLVATARALRSLIGAVNGDAFQSQDWVPEFEKMWTGSEKQRANAALLFGVSTLSPASRPL